MSRSMNDLSRHVREAAFETISIAKKNGVDLLIYCTDRPADEQARVFRSTRRLAEIQRKIEWYHEKGHHELAFVLDGVGPQYCNGIINSHKTYAGPGQSWHQFGEAFDMCPIVGGKLLWDRKIYHLQWKICIDAVAEVGLLSGADENDYPHVYQRSGSPLKIMQEEEIKKVADVGLANIRNGIIR